jgi:thymidine phosphorylase
MNDQTTFMPQELIRQKRDNQPLDLNDIERFVAGITDSTVTDAQIAAFAMAIFLNGMSAEEGATLTLSMRDSGDVIDWQGLGFDADAPIVDKHSTGGVGDKVSLMLAPIVAACGGYVPMISGRGLGHSGGTLDKLESIPGYNPYPTVEHFADITKNIGCSIIGQTGSLAPADKRFYAVRDVTGTVESIPLITASILSKKLAAGLNALVMDVKFGNGAFMDSQDKARALAQNIVRVAKAANVPTTALLTDMNQVLGRTAGNAVEVFETIEFLKNPGAADQRLVDVTLDLAAHMLFLAGLFADVSAAREKAAEALSSGKAAEIFAKMVAVQGGPADLLEHPDKYLSLAPIRRVVHSARAGYVSAMDTRAIGVAVVALGGGRIDPAHTIDHSVGLTDIAQIGDKIDIGQPMATIYAQSEGAAEVAVKSILESVDISDTDPGTRPITAEIIEG